MRDVRVIEAGTSVRRCGTCFVCCWIPEVPELHKPAEILCEFCETGQERGCQVYERRPESCKNFFCLYAVNKTLPDELRPDRCHVLFEPLAVPSTILALVDPEFPWSWQTSSVQKLIRSILNAGIAILISEGADPSALRHIVLPDGRSREDVMSDIEYSLEVMVGLNYGSTDLRNRS